MIPDALRVDECDGALVADLQTVDLAAKDTMSGGKIEFAESFFQVIPGLQAGLPIATLGFGLIAA